MRDAEIAVQPLHTGRRGSEPLLWLSAGAVVVALSILVLLLALLVIEGMSYFWPRPLLMVEGVAIPTQLGQVVERQPQEVVGVERDGAEAVERLLINRGTGRTGQSPLVWLDDNEIDRRSWPERALVVERVLEPPVFAFLHAIDSGDGPGQTATPFPADLSQFPAAVQLEALEAARLQYPGSSVSLRLVSGEALHVALSDLGQVYAPNAMGWGQKTAFLLSEIAAFLSDPPRQVNAEGGVFPAIVGTVVLVLIMSILVTPLGILAAVYLQEYAHRGPLTRVVRIAVNNLAGVPSIVFGVFGLGFFVYGVGGSLDSVFFADALPAPTLGSPGLLWASLTMALLTLPVVIVATEEGLARVPHSLREGSLALGATRAETLWRVVLPAASPALLTGLILAVARATGEVAPLILVGVAKYAPALPVSGDFPFVHLDRQFMHLGFHIFDLGFQSPQLALTTGRVFATALLLVLIVLLLNLVAVILRSRLREAFRT